MLWLLGAQLVTWAAVFDTRQVNTALAEEMKEIHALSIKKVLTPEQFAAQQV